MRYALMYPEDVDQLVLVDPIGLEDWKAKGVPWQSVDGWYAQELKTTADSIRNYERTTYYAGTWSPRYERWVQMLAGLYRGPGRDIVAWNSALLDDMIYTQPVFYEFEQVKVPVLLMIGDKDTTAFGKNLAPPAVRATLGKLSGAGEGGGGALSARPAGRVSRSGTCAANPGARCFPQSAARRHAVARGAVRRGAIIGKNKEEDDANLYRGDSQYRLVA